MRHSTRSRTWDGGVKTLQPLATTACGHGWDTEARQDGAAVMLHERRHDRTTPTSRTRGAA